MAEDSIFLLETGVMCDTTSFLLEIDPLLAICDASWTLVVEDVFLWWLIIAGSGVSLGFSNLVGGIS